MRRGLFTAAKRMGMETTHDKIKGQSSGAVVRGIPTTGFRREAQGWPAKRDYPG
jgi:hypothetical protein